MKLKQATIGCALSALLAVPAIGLAAGAAQSGAEPQSDSANMHSASQQGEQHPGVRAVQEKLKSKGYNVKHVDGIWGQDSIGALKQFQQSKHLKKTGTLDSRTAQALGLNKSEFAAFETEVKEGPGGRHRQPDVQERNPGSGATGGGGPGGGSLHGSGTTPGGGTAPGEPMGGGR